MATTVRGGGAGAGREKRGTSPSPSLVKKSAKPSTSSSSSATDPEKAASSPTDGKPIPNYLKPTLSSKRSNTDSSTQKPNLNRRRSFDRPPTSQLQKAVRSTFTLKEVRPVRSSSFSNRTVSAPSSSSPRPALDRHSNKAPGKDVKGESNLSKPRSLKKSTLSSTSTPRKDLNGGGIPKKKAPKSVTSESSIDYENRSVDHAGIEDDMVNIDNEVESLPEISEMPDSNEELDDPTNLEIEAKHDEEEHKVEQSVDHEDKSAAVDEVVEETAPPESGTPEVHHERKEDQTVEEQPEQETAEESDVQQEEIQSVEQNQIGEVAVEEEAEAPKEETTEEKLEEAKKEDESSGKEAEQKEEKESASSPAAPAAAAAPARAQAAGKKENQAYNAVIEETATKLMGGKKNKVLALAGAFETVIKLQDNNKN